MPGVEDLRLAPQQMRHSVNSVSDVVDERVTDGRRIAELLASEIEGRTDGSLEVLSVTDADRSVEPSPNGNRAYDISTTASVIGQVYVHPTRARLELTDGQIAAREAVDATELQWRATGDPAPKLLIFLPDGVAVKRVLPVLRAAVTATDEA